MRYFLVLQCRHPWTQTAGLNLNLFKFHVIFVMRQKNLTQNGGQSSLNCKTFNIFVWNLFNGIQQAIFITNACYFTIFIQVAFFLYESANSQPQTTCKKPPYVFDTTSYHTLLQSITQTSGFVLLKKPMFNNLQSIIINFTSLQLIFSRQI